MKTSIFIAGALLAISGGAALADSSKCGGLSGYYGGVTAIVVGKDGSTVNVTMDGGRPNAYGSCSGNSLKVTFPDDRSYSGTFDGKTISWSNGTTWTKR